MKKLIFSMAVLAAISTTSCKKAYECTCTSTDHYSYETVTGGSYDATDVAIMNSNQSDYESNYPTSTETTTVTEKTTKADVNASCASSTNVKGTVNRDTGDADGDLITNEPSYKSVTTTTTDCSVEKK